MSSEDVMLFIWVGEVERDVIENGLTFDVMIVDSSVVT